MNRSIGWERAGILGLALDKNWSLTNAARLIAVSIYEPRRGRDRLRRAFNLIHTFWPAAYRAVTATVRVASIGVALTLPYDSSSERWPGIVLVSDCPPLDMAEALVHEAAHQYLLALHQVLPLWRDSGHRFHSPWQTRPRPARGLLLGIHAFTLVTEFYRRLPRHRRWADYRVALRGREISEAIQALSPYRHELPPAGQQLLEACEERAGVPSR